MHLVPEDRAHRRAIDEHRVCDAIAAIGDPETVRDWAGRFSLLAEPNRLSVLLRRPAGTPTPPTAPSTAKRR